jgi:hypothetical protein
MSLLKSLQTAKQLSEAPVFLELWSRVKGVAGWHVLLYRAELGMSMYCTIALSQSVFSASVGTY